MGKYVVLYHATPAAMESMKDATPEDMQKGMEPWMAWAAKCGDSLLDIGSPLGPARKVNSAGGSPADTSVVGYSLLEAESMEAAQALLEGHPHVEWRSDCTIEVHEAMPLPV